MVLKEDPRGSRYVEYVGKGFRRNFRWQIKFRHSVTLVADEGSFQEPSTLSGLRISEESSAIYTQDDLEKGETGIQFLPVFEPSSGRRYLI